MNNNNIEITKRSLVGAFSLIVFAVILIMGAIFFTTKYTLFNHFKDEFPGKIIYQMYPNHIGVSGVFVQQIRLEPKLTTQERNTPYIMGDYFADLIVFLALTILFSILIYFIGRKFVNTVFVPVEKNFNDMNDFIHNAGHELKTPLSVIDSNIQLLKESKIYDENMIDELKNETTKLNSLLDSLINLNDIGSFGIVEELNLKEQIEEILKNFEEKIKRKKLLVNVDVKDDVLVKADKNYFYIFLSNLLYNAIKYNKKEGTIDIIYKEGYLEIKDTGIGIKSENLNKIFDRFYKVDTSRSTEGFGIGLALVKQIANVYTWKINVESVEGEGTSFKVKF